MQGHTVSTQPRISVFFFFFSRPAPPAAGRRPAAEEAKRLQDLTSPQMAATTADPPPTLIFYEPPLLVEGGSAELAALAAGSKRAAGAKGAQSLDDVINSILPPRMWSQPDGTTWMQYTSKAPPSRPELAQLQAALDQRLQQRQARSAGLCAVRSELYSQLFGACGRCPCAPCCAAIYFFSRPGALLSLLFPPSPSLTLFFCFTHARAHAHTPRNPLLSQTSSFAR